MAAAAGAAASTASVWGPAVIGAIGAIGGGLLGSKGSKKSAKAQLKAARETNALQRYMYEQSRSDLMPYRQTGYGALTAMNRVMGLGQVNTNPTQFGYDGKRNVYQMGSYGGGSYGVLGGDYSGQFTPSKMTPEMLQTMRSMGYDVPEYLVNEPQGQMLGGTYDEYGNPVDDRYGGFYASPGYQFAYDQAMKGAERAASAGGYLPSGNGGASGRFSKEMARYSQGLASQEFGNYFNRLGVLAGVGQTATSEGNTLGANYAANAGNVMMAAGDARASGIMGSSNAWAGAIEGVSSAFGDYLKNRQPSSTNSQYGPYADGYKFPSKT